MNEVVTYIRCQINGKWTNLGLIAEEGEIQEHFEFVEGLLKKKQRADELEKRWSELRERMEHDEKEAFGEGDVIAYTVHNYVLELMHDLQEDDNDR